MIDRPERESYLSTVELTQFVPWSKDAIEKKIARGVLKRNVHFFYVDGRRLFKWSSIVSLIETPAEEGAGPKANYGTMIPMLRGGTLGEGPKN